MLLICLPVLDIRDMKDYWLTPGIQQRKALPPVGVDQDPSVKDPAEDGDNNPWFTLHQVKNSFMRDRLFGNIKADFKIACTYFSISQIFTGHTERNPRSENFEEL